MSESPIEHGHAAWVWGDWRGLGERWELVVPSGDFEDSGTVVFPLMDDHEDYAENILDCPMRKIEMPTTPPTQAEIVAAEQRAVEQVEGDDE